MSRTQHISHLAFSIHQSLWSCSKGVALQVSLNPCVSSTSSCNLFIKHTHLTSFARCFASLPPHTVIGMPSLSPTMNQGNLAKWRKKEGDVVAPGHIFAEVETDKATLEWEAQEEGYIARLLIADGAQNVAVGAPVAIIVDEASDVAAFKGYTPGGQAAPASKPTTPSAPAAAAAAPATPKSTFPPHQVLNMPALSPTMSHGNIVSWKKAVGDEVKPGELLCDVETDKATISWEAQEEGFIAKILCVDGTRDIAIGSPTLVLVENKEDLPAFASFTADDARAPARPAAAAPASTPAPKASPSASPSSPAAAPKVTPTKAQSGDRVISSPYARKLAAAEGVSLEGLAGSGPGGRIVAEDVKKAAAAPKAPAAAAAVPAGPYTDIPHTQIRRITAARLLQSKTTVPHYYLSMECQVDNMLAMRSQINASGVKISVNDIVIKAAALALRKVPAINASWTDDFIRTFNYVDISVAVQTPVGLMVPIVKDADKKGLDAINKEVMTLATKAKEGKLAPAEFTGGTFTVSNLGMFGVRQFAAIINPPQAAILAVGGTDKKVVLDKETGKFKEVSTLIATLSCDHRVVDGAVGASWLQAFKGYLENPYTMLL